MNVSNWIALCALFLSAIALIKSLLTERELNKSRRIKDELNEIKLEKVKRKAKNTVKKY